MVNPKHIEFLDKVFVRKPYFEASAYKVGKLGEVLKTNVFKNAIWLASAEFFSVLQKKDFGYDLLSAKERLTALKFYNRMSFRGTPFGAFSAFGLANWNVNVKHTKVSGQRYTLHLLPSAEEELNTLQSRPISDDLLIAVNPTLYQLSTGWRYSRYDEEKEGKLSFCVYLLQYDPADELLLAQLQEKPVPFQDLIDYLVELTDCTREEGESHITRLIKEQVLISSNALSLLTDRSSGKHEKVPLDNEFQLFDEVTMKGLGFTGKETGRAFYAGTEMDGAEGLAMEWQQDILQALEILDLLAPKPPKNNLDKFREAFEQRFGERCVPLLEALDPDLGVTFDDEQQSNENDLLKGVVFKSEAKNNNQVNWTPVHQLLTKIWLQNNRRNAWDPIVLSPADFTDLPRNTLPFPPSTSVFCYLSGDQLIFQNIGGSTANALTGRFSAFSNEFDVFCKETAKFECEANPDILFAEIEQLNHRKIDNINRRRQIYEHVINLNTFPVAGTILPKDIDVRIRGEELILSFRPTGKRIIPRLPTAYNYHHSEMPLFRFLCALQYKDIRANFDFDPEKIVPGLNFYPRIEYGRCVISLARWYLNDTEVAALVQRPLSISRLHLFCRERGVPSMISVGKGDQQLFFDLANDDEAIFFLEALAEQAGTVLTESLVNRPGNLGDGFNSQYVVSLRNLQPAYVPLAGLPQPPPVIRDFQPGSEWVYIKIYGTYQSLEQTLSAVILPWIGENQNLIKQWFFVRYYDTGSHLRLRLKVDLVSVKDVQFELQSLLNPVQKSGLIQKVYFDTYQREIERYHAALIENVEEVFFRGSEVIAARLTGSELRDQIDLIWPIVHCYRIITVFFGAQYDQVHQLCTWAAQAFFKEQGADKDLKRSMDERYRELRPALLKAIEDNQDDELDTPVKLLYEKADFLNALGRQKLIADVVHMQVNRVFISNQRRYETFIWHCLSKVSVTIMKRQVSVEALLIDDP
jgi:thiopeptide-type bacteriocin biosynthesis protein